MRKELTQADRYESIPIPTPELSSSDGNSGDTK